VLGDLLSRALPPQTRRRGVVPVRIMRAKDGHDGSHFLATSRTCTTSPYNIDV